VAASVPAKADAGKVATPTKSQLTPPTSHEECVAIEVYASNGPNKTEPEERELPAQALASPVSAPTVRPSDVWHSALSGKHVPMLAEAAVLQAISPSDVFMEAIHPHVPDTERAMVARPLRELSASRPHPTASKVAGRYRRLKDCDTQGHPVSLDAPCHPVKMAKEEANSMPEWDSSVVVDNSRFPLRLRSGMKASMESTALSSAAKIR